MNAQQYQAEVMDELKQQDDYDDDTMVCIYCGSQMVESYISCCGEVHFDTAKNVEEYHK